VLDRLHRSGRAQKRGLARLALSRLSDRLARRSRSVAEEASELRDLYISLSPKQGTFAYLVARSLRAQRIVEFGTSFGVSSIYLAAAIRDNGGGLLIGSEFEPHKVVGARANIEEAGLADLVEIREGDARETLKDPGGPVDLVLLDGMKEIYTTIIETLKPHLRRGAVVLADNIFTFRRVLAPYVAYMRENANGFESVTLFLGDGTEYSIRL
jgi:predicted O-methyltransferase YrrM